MMIYNYRGVEYEGMQALHIALYEEGIREPSIAFIVEHVTRTKEKLALEESHADYIASCFLKTRDFLSRTE